MKTYQIYLERADDDKPAVLLGTMKAETESEALNKAAQYFEYPQHDLLAKLATTITPEWWKRQQS